MVKPTQPSPEFMAEAQEIVDALNRDLIAAEAEAKTGEVPPQRVNSLFRSAHSLKGISGMFGLDGMRLGKVKLDASALDVLFACVERFGTLIAAAESGEPADGDVDDEGVDH